MTLKKKLNWIKIIDQIEHKIQELHYQKHVGSKHIYPNTIKPDEVFGPGSNPNHHWSSLAKVFDGYSLWSLGQSYRPFIYPNAWSWLLIKTRYINVVQWYKESRVINYWERRCCVGQIPLSVKVWYQLNEKCCACRFYSANSELVSYHLPPPICLRNSELLHANTYIAPLPYPYYNNIDLTDLPLVYFK